MSADRIPSSWDHVANLFLAACIFAGVLWVLGLIGRRIDKTNEHGRQLEQRVIELEKKVR